MFVCSLSPISYHLMPLGILILSLLLGIVATRLILLPVDLLYLLHVPGWLLLAGLLVLASWLLGE